MSKFSNVVSENNSNLSTICAKNYLSKIFLPMFLFIFTTAFLLSSSPEVFAKAAKPKVSKIKYSALGFTLEGELRMLDEYGDGEYDSWKFKGTLDPPIGSNKPVQLGGKLNIVGGNSNQQLPEGIEIDPNGLGFEFTTDGVNISFSIPLLDSNGNEIGIMQYNDDYTGSNEALVFIYLLPTSSKSVINSELSTSKVGLGIKIVSSNNNQLVYEFNSPYDRGIDLFLYDVTGKVVQHYIRCAKGKYTHTIDNLLSGQYFIYSPISNKSSIGVVVTE